MCHEMWMWWRRERDREHDENLWELFDRETRNEAPRSLSDDDREPAEATTPGRATASTQR